MTTTTYDNIGLRYTLLYYPTLVGDDVVRNCVSFIFCILCAFTNGEMFGLFFRVRFLCLLHTLMVNPHKSRTRVAAHLLPTIEPSFWLCSTHTHTHTHTCSVKLISLPLTIRAHHVGDDDGGQPNRSFIIRLMMVVVVDCFHLFYTIILSISVQFRSGSLFVVSLFLFDVSISSLPSTKVAQR